MGTEIRLITVEACGNKEFEAKLKDLIAEDKWTRGNDSYNGALFHCSRGREYIHPKGAKATWQEVEDFLIDKTSKYEMNFAKVGDFSKAFPETKQDKKIVEDLAEVEKQLKSYYSDICNRFLNAKSSSKKCDKCESVITKTGFKAHLRRVEVSEKIEQMSPLQTATYEEAKVACPCCGADFLITNTDETKKKALREKQKTLKAKHAEAVGRYEAKVPRDKRPYWLICAAAPC